MQIIDRSFKQNEGSRDVDKVLLKSKSTKRDAFIGGTIDFLHMKQKYFISDDEFFPAFVVIGVRKDFCCKEKLDDVIHLINVSGLYNKLMSDNAFLKLLERYFHAVDDDDDDGGGEHKLPLTDFRGAFIFLTGAHILSLTLFISEVSFFKLRFFSRDGNK